MCIAIYSPIGNDLPCWEYLENSFDNNPDGAGFAYNTDQGNVQIEKGFMTWKAFKKAIEKSNKKNDLKNRGVLIHFRITTHGGTNQECCHPFPLVADEAAMKKTNIRTNYAVIHNGIISLTSNEAHLRQKMSDTMVFIEKYLSKIATNKKWFNNKSNFELIGDLIDSKMAILNGYGEIHATDGFVKDKDGNYYSNTTYKEDRWKWYTSPSYKVKNSLSPYSSGWNFDDDDDEYEVWTNSDKKKNAVEVAPTWANLMRLKQGMGVYFADGWEDVYSASYPYFIDELGNVFACAPEDINEINKTVKHPYFYGEGTFLDTMNFQPVDFVADYKALESDLYVDYCDVPNE